jgi:hypothetical protein
MYIGDKSAMTDSEFFELRVKAFLLFCWQRKYVFLLLFLVAAAAIYIALASLQAEKYRTTFQFAKLDYDSWSPNFYSLKAADIYLKSHVPAGDAGGKGGRTFSADISEEDLATPDDFAKMVLNKAPKARIVAGVAEIQLITKDPNFVDKVFLPLIDISRQIVIDTARERQGRVDQIYAQLSKGNLSQKERETIEEGRLNSHISTLARESDAASAIDTRELEKNEIATPSAFDRLRWAIVLSLVASVLAFLAVFTVRGMRASPIRRAAPEKS